MNVLSIFDWISDISKYIFNLTIITNKSSLNLVRWICPLTLSVIISWISYKLFSLFWFKSRSPSDLHISSKLFEDFNNLFQSNNDGIDTNNDLSRLHRLPAVLIDLSAFDSNIELLREQMLLHPNTTIRIASKSIRVPSLLKRILSYGFPFKGLMCYSVEETEFLSSLGFDDFLIAYPSQQKLDYEILRNLHEKEEKLVRIVVDDLLSIEEMNEFMKGINKPFPIILEYDVSFRLFQGNIHIGARRSPIRNLSQLIHIIQSIQQLKFVQLEGLMVYESHIAGIGDINPANFWLNPIIRCIKAYSIPRIQQTRKELSKICLKYGLTLFNGGGTGSLLSSLNESSVLTEITVGSGFFQSHLFDHYQQNELMIEKYKTKLIPSCYFALPIVRISDQSEWITCFGGGYIASGKPGWDKIPIPIFPQGLQISSDEGTGEVQTPLKLSSKTTNETFKLLKHNGIVYFRHAKGGELAERFNQFLIINNGNILESAKTYRGFGKCFF